MSTYRTTRLVILLFPVLVLIALFWRYVVPGGERTVVYEMGESSPFVQRLLPDERVSALHSRQGDTYVVLLDEPVYFSVTPPPGNFEQVSVEVAFDPGGTPVLELGGLQDVAAQAFDFQPLSNAVLEDAAWTRHDLSEGLAVFSRDSQSDAYQTFLENPPDRSRVATYRATFPTPYREAGYVPLGARQKFDVSLRGSHELLTYIKNEDFSFEVVYTDVNRTYGADEGFVKVFDEQNNLMTEFVLVDDDNVYENQVPSAKTVVRLAGQGWEEGVYRIVLSGTSDILWRSIATPQRYLVVKNRVFIADDVGYLASPRATSVFTNADRVTLETQHVEGLQTVMLGGTPLLVEDVGVKYAGTVPGTGVVELKSPVGDLKITGEGKYAFSRASFFDPDPLPLTAFTDLENGQIEHVLANLAPVAFSEGWRVASAQYAANELAQENGAFKFALSAPGVHEQLGQPAIHAFQVTFTRPPLSAPEFFRELKHFVKLLLP
jgi:hypothetical protein